MVEAQPPERLEILGVSHPDRAIVGRPFEVNVTIRYHFSKEWKVVIDVYDVEEAKSVAQTRDGWPVMTLLTGQGTKTYSVQVQGLGLEKAWKLSALVGIWEFTEKNKFTWFAKDFLVRVSEKAVLTLRTIPPIQGLRVAVDEEVLITDGDGTVKVELSVLKQHRLAVPTVQNITEGTRAVFTRWGDGFKSNERAGLTLEADLTLLAIYKLQHLVSVRSGYSNTSGSGWYDEGTKVTVSVTSPVPMEGLLGFLGGKLVFAGWEGDASGVDPIAEVLVDGPKAITASWKADYSGPLLTLGPAAVMTALALLFVLKRRRPRKVSLYSSLPRYPLPRTEDAAMGKFCVECGSKISLEASYCSYCSAKQP